MKEYQIDVNVTALKGASAMLMNGTSLTTAANETFIYKGGQMNHTRNATVDFISPQKVYIVFTPEEGYTGRPVFMADIGLREFNRTIEDDDDDYKTPKVIDII